MIFLIAEFVLFRFFSLLNRKVSGFLVVHKLANKEFPGVGCPSLRATVAAKQANSNCNGRKT